MSRIGITGHSNLTAESVPAVAEGIRVALAGHGRDGLIGVTCLGRGADQVFARVVLELGGAVEVVLPASDYRERKVKPDNAAEFDELLGQAKTVHTMPFDTSNREAYMAASEHLLDNVDTVSPSGTAAPPAATAAQPKPSTQHAIAACPSPWSGLRPLAENERLTGLSLGLDAARSLQGARAGYLRVVGGWPVAKDPVAVEVSIL
ncbi:hypothetical protein ACFWQL_40510 [Amycolatopsis thermoflava]|uniref:hypothetical protein n=1 Tax=Amycolatopsis thermoflava TaxID=84480 RepID=UPI00365891BA